MFGQFVVQGRGAQILSMFSTPYSKKNMGIILIVQGVLLKLNSAIVGAFGLQD